MAAFLATSVPILSTSISYRRVPNFFFLKKKETLIVTGIGPNESTTQAAECIHQGKDSTREEMQYAN